MFKSALSLRLPSSTCSTFSKLTQHYGKIQMSSISSSSSSSSSSSTPTTPSLPKHAHDKTVDLSLIGDVSHWMVPSKDGLCELAVDRFTPTKKLTQTYLPAHNVVDNAEMLFCHANGYSRYTLRPLLAELRALGDQHSYTTMDFMGHGDSTVGGRSGWNWWHHSDDVASVIDSLQAKIGEQTQQKRRKPLIGVGHSMGGAAILMTEIRNPGTFKCIIAIEPVALPIPKDMPKDAYDYLVTIANKRKSTFSSFSAAKKQFVSKPAFECFDERALNEYVYHCLKSNPDGTVSLKCDPSTEAQNYRMGSHDLYYSLKNITCPVLFLAGEESVFLPHGLIPDQAALVKHGRALTLEKFGHMIPMEGPQAVAKIILEYLLEVNSKKASKL